MFPPLSLERSPKHTLVVSHDPCTPTCSLRSHPVPCSASHTAKHSPPFLRGACFMQAHMHAHINSQTAFAWFSMAIPPSPGASTGSLLHGVTKPHPAPAHASTPSPTVTPPHTLPLHPALLEPTGAASFSTVTHTHTSAPGRATLAVTLPIAGPYRASHRPHAPFPWPAGIIFKPFYCPMSGFMG